MSMVLLNTKLFFILNRLFVSPRLLNNYEILFQDDKGIHDLNLFLCFIIVTFQGTIYVNSFFILLQSKTVISHNFRTLFFLGIVWHRFYSQVCVIRDEYHAGDLIDLTKTYKITI